ncbi:hypothetical protein Ocin01_06999 [Orchesella cincta]|uniref:Uncharacterized protein n=1 Tax=Orchesella cincta TaxID=48709 RepID=A0A1D2N353_ORCCI|nr:hypothetical protein Ocin01_06999 [Orchesella cincta]
MDCKLKSSILTTLVVISITLISSEPVGYGHGFQPFSRRVPRRDDHGPQHYVVPIMRNNNHFTDKHQHIVKENYVQPPSTQPTPESLTTKKPMVVVTTTPEVTTTTIQPQGRTLTATKEPLSGMNQVKVYGNFQTLKTTTTEKPSVETTTAQIRQSATEPTTESSPLKLTTKQIPEIRNGNQEAAGNDITEKTHGESKDGKVIHPIIETTQQPTEGIIKSQTSKVQDRKDGKVKKHRHRHHHSRHGHYKHHRLSKGNQTGHGKEHKSHHHYRSRSHNQHKNKNTSGSHSRQFHGMKSSIRGNSHTRNLKHHSEGLHGGTNQGAYPGRRVKRGVHKRSDESEKGTGVSGESTSIEGNELESDESGAYSESGSEEGRAGDSQSMSVLDIAPGPYLQHHSEEDDSNEAARIDGVFHEPILNNWGEYVEYQRSSLLADPDTKATPKNTGFIPVMETEDHFKYIDKQYKDKNDRMIAFHNLQNFMRQQRKKFRIPEPPQPNEEEEHGGRIFVDLMSDTDE